MNELKDKCEQYLLDNNIPYNKNVIFNKGLNLQFIFDFIIPKAIIKFLSPHNYDKTINNLTQYTLPKIPSDFSIYIYYNKILPEYILEDIDNPRIKLIDNFDKIKQTKFEYHLINYSFITAICALKNNNYDNLINTYKNTTFLMTQRTYDSSTILMNEKELDRLKKLNIKIVNKFTENDIMINNTEFMHVQTRLENTEYKEFKINHLFQYFTIHWDVYSLQSSIPARHVYGLTVICKSCDGVYFPKWIKDGDCIKCRDALTEC